MSELEKKIDALSASVEELKQQIAEIRRVMPIFHYQSTQQLEILEALLRLLDVDRGYLPPTRGWAASPDILMIIARHILDARPAMVVECGSGVSTIVAARCLEKNGVGRIYSLEHDDQQKNRTIEMLRARGLDTLVSVIHAPLTACSYHGVDMQWYDPAAVPGGEIDVLFIDGPPVTPKNVYGRYPAGPNLFPRLAAGALVVVDDVLREVDHHVVNRWRQEFPGADWRTETTEKGSVTIRFAAPAGHATAGATP